MCRTCSLGLLLAAVLLPGCSREGPAPVEQTAPKTVPVGQPGPLPGALVGGLQGAPLPGLEAGNQEKHDSALQDAFNLLAARKYPEALTALEAARTFRDSEFLRAEIAKLRARIDQQAAAERTAQDIQTVLDQGRSAEAAQLAGAALQQYGATDIAPRLIRLKLQADTLAASGLTDNAARQRRFRDEADAAVKGKNLRAAAVALEQALQYGDAPDLRRQFDAVRLGLARYDECRAKAAELRRDPATLEDALAQLQEAAKAWDTLQVRQEIDEYRVALQNRRDRAGVADFEVRGDVGIPAAGRTLADELLPFLRPRYDLVERGQLGKVVEELKLSAGRLAESDQDRREVGRVAKLRYLVVGSITPVGGVTAHARLVDVKTGLIVQTAKVVAPNPDQLAVLMPELGKQLLMSDAERLAYEQQQARVAKLPPPLSPDAPLPPPPEPPVQGQPLPPPVILDTPQAVPLGGVVLRDFQRLPPPPPQGQPVQVVEVVQVVEPPVKRRLLALSLEVGDNLFRRGQYREAHRHFQFALNLAPGHTDVQLRVDRCRPLLPPPPPVVVQPQVTSHIHYPPPPPPRVALLDFAVLADARAVPPGLGTWTPQNLAPYFCPSLQVVDRGEVSWYLARTGVTLRDLMTDPHARRWLGRALNVRYFLLGNIHQADAAGTLEVSAHLLDAEHGFVQGAGRVFVHNPYELKLRLGELARLTLMDPAERLRYEQQAQPYETLVVEAHKRSERGELTVAVGLFQKALGLRPGSIEVQVHLQRTSRAAERAALEEARRREFERVQAEIREQRRQQLELARLAEEARVRAAAQAAALAENQRRLEEERRQREQQAACNQLVVQARVAFKRGDFNVAVQMFEGAAGLRSNDDVYRELAQARAEAARARRERDAAEEARREAERQRAHAQELAAARLRLEEEQRRRRAEEADRRRAQEQRDQAAYQQLFDEGQRLLNRGQHDAAVAALQSARRMRKTDAVEALLNRAMAEQAATQARARGENERRELERRLAAERQRREKAEAEAKRNQQLYQQALQLAQQALAEKNYDTAHAKYEEAGRLYRTDVVLTGLREVESRRAEARTQAALEQKRRQETEQKAANLRRLLVEGQAALAAGQPDKAVQTFGEAKRLAPDNVDALAGLSKAEQARDRSRAEARRRQEEQDRQTAFRKLLTAGQANLANRQYDAAVLSLNEALKLRPGDAAATLARDQAEKARAQTATDALKQKQADAQRAEQARLAAERAKKQAAYQAALHAGQAALAARRHDEAVRALTEANRLNPADQGVVNLLNQARTGQQQARAAQDAETQRRAAEQRRQAEFARLLALGQQATAGKRYVEAIKAYQEALKVRPNDPTGARLLAEATRALDASRTPPQPAPVPQPQPKQPAPQPPAPPPPQSKQPTPPQPQPKVAPPPPQSKQPPPQPKPPAQAPAPKSPAPPPPQPQPKVSPAQPKPPPPAQAEFGKRMQAAAMFEKQQKFTEAVKAYEEALKFVPQDAKAAEGLRNARYTLHMTQGQAHLNARRFPDAAREFEAALRVRPNDRLATEGLTRARAMR